MADWSEEGEAPRVTFTILAIDGDARDAAEMKRFNAELTTPADGEYGTSRGVERLPGWAGALGLLLLPLLWLSGSAAPALGGAAVLAFDVALVITVVAALLVPRIAAARERARRGRLDERRRFEMVVAGDTVTLTAPGAAERSFPLRDIARFDAGPRVSIVRNDGSAVRLPFVIDTGPSPASTPSLEPVTDTVPPLWNQPEFVWMALPSSLATVIVPPMRSTSCLVIASPSPVPP